jgi:hypothetical membrane protein
MEHIIILTLVGLAVVGVFVITAGMMGASRARAARASIAAWFIGALANAAFGVFGAGIPPVNEIAAFVPIFGIPAAVAFALSNPRAVL